MNEKLKTEKEIDTIRGKLLVGHATLRETQDFLTYVAHIEALVEEASLEDFYGTEGWRHKMGWD